MHRFKPPYACNGCRGVKKCTLTKTVYDALEAHRQATEQRIPFVISMDVPNVDTIRAIDDVRHGRNLSQL